ncbi:MAG TPA: hypothetical protein VFK44_01725 [Bacillales bacterium]|nr:hypothetical protein [Bacillales bacterium]
MSEQALKIAEAWQKAVNDKDIKKLLALSHGEIEMAGPKGSAFGHGILVEWIGKAGLSLQTRARYVKDDIVVLEQDGVWTDGDGNVTGEANVSTVMKVEDGKVKYVSRYDNDLDKALTHAGLSRKDQI